MKKSRFFLEFFVLFLAKISLGSQSSPLHLTVQQGDIFLTQKLLSNSVNPFVEDSNMQTASELAKDLKYSSIYNLLKNMKLILDEKANKKYLKNRE